MSSERLFDEPSISRQWVIRRLQRALTLDLAAAAFQEGIARTARGDAAVVAASLAAAADRRAHGVRSLIEREGSVPYQSIGLARACCRFGGMILGLLGSWTWKTVTRMLAEHTLQEYDLLVAYVDGAPGVSPDLKTQAAPLLQEARSAYATATAG